ncbi:HNH endonuclease signature motif containing protein [Deinococcus aestuarii]|uniref:HNH endonuclease signature motif containing protein n=1 Tax=Deinococcus aestuarii TaxID=2774531 RepID=UPI001C0CD3EF
MLQRCLYCGGEFDAPPQEVDRGNGKFCSTACSARHQWRDRQEKEPNCSCAFCGTPLYRIKSKQLASRSGLIFCDRKGKERAQTRAVKLLEVGCYKDGRGSHRSIALRDREAKCELCGYDAVPEVLEVHHVDRDRSNNHPSNLQLLCPTCHTVQHFITRTGKSTPRRVSSLRCGECARRWDRRLSCRPGVDAPPNRTPGHSRPTTPPGQAHRTQETT